MSRTPNFFIEKMDEKTGKYDFQHPVIYDKEKGRWVVSDLFPYNGTHDVFSIVEEDDSLLPKMNGIHSGLPKDVSLEIQQRFNYANETSFNKNLAARVRWFTYADMYIYLLEHPKTIDNDALDEAYCYQAEGEIIDPKNYTQDNPLFLLKKRIDAFLEVTTDWVWEDDFSLIRIIYWFD